MAQEIVMPSGYNYPGRTQLGTLEQMQQAATAQQAAAAQLAQAQSLTQARLAGLPVPQTGVPMMPQPNIPALQSQLGQLSGMGGGAPALEAGPALSSPWRAPTTNFPPVESPIPMSRVGALNAERSMGTFGAQLQNDIAALRGGGPTAATPMAGSLAEDIAALRGGGVGAGATGVSSSSGLLSSLAGRYGLEGGIKGAGGLGGYLGAGPMGAVKTLGARAGQGMLYSLAPTALGMGVEAFGPQIENALGLNKGSTKGAAQAGADVGTGAMLGTLIAPGPGTLVGAALGGLKNIVPLAGELAGDITGSGVAQQWGKATNGFNKAISKTNKNTIGKKGVAYLNDNYFAAAQEIERQAKAGEISHSAAVQGMNKLTTMMNKDIKTLQSQHKATKASGKKQTAIQIQMGQAMEKLAADTRAMGAAGQATLNNLAMDPNMAAIAPILQASGQLRAQAGNNMADAYISQAYNEIPQQELDAKLAELRQLNQQIQAAQNAGGGGGSGSLSDLAAKVK